MSLPVDLRLIERALDALERLEVRVLVWGLVDSALSDEEVTETLDSVLNGHAEDLCDPICTIDGAASLRQRLVDLALVFSVPVRPGEPARWRTRMAEGLRLVARLRQMFPGKHAGRDAWVNAPTLVADFRLLWRPRCYPKRDQTSSQALEQLCALVQSADVIEAIRHWFGKSSFPLAKFQIDAAARILPALAAGTPKGTLVSAGTGSGKTLAFYLPALSWLAAEKRARPSLRAVRILAIYPRNELLKDQLAEVYSQARKFDDFLGPTRTAPISVGVLYGATPNTLKAAAAGSQWKAVGGSSLCPFFRCTQDGCDGELVLRREDMQADNERLVCRSCGWSVDRATLKFTRRSMQQEPPDVLFTSVEMLNQRMSDSEMRHLFGLGPQAQRAPAVVLLDEVHVYGGTYGAQVAHLLRRWSAMTGRRSSFVGLSATLAEGSSFFAALTGMDNAIVEEISPREEHMEQEGAEYMVALRGDPVSQSALLSTSIQTLMLCSRLVDTESDFGRGRPFYGWRSFAFTDQVDATNRLYYDLLDAEGRDRFRRPALRRHPQGGLAALRAPGPSLRRYTGGQDWRLAREIGHDLSARHDVSRTTAYDTGVDSHAQVVVATAALEVGYDDPAVGVVLQHKAPRDIAQFLQRKGRAGRSRHMRPWTIMVLSDYGRDRVAYQAYEQFFDPQLPHRELPLTNRYVRRMQAVYALIDYLGLRMQAGQPAGSVWRDLAGRRSFPAFDHWPLSVRDELRAMADACRFPMDDAGWKSLVERSRARASGSQLERWQAANWLAYILRRRHLVDLLNRILREPEAAEGLARHVASALDQPRAEVDALLWDHPRPLLLAAIPTALRRVATDWRGEEEARHPLPEFIPATLFSDLSLPEMRIEIPRRDGNHYLSVLQGLSELAPGKVSRRFDYPLWLGVDAPELQMILAQGAPQVTVEGEVGGWYLLDSQPSIAVVEDGRVVQYAAFRPLVARLTAIPTLPELRDTSNARLEWRSQLFARRAGSRLESPVSRVGIASLVEAAYVHTHAGHTPTTVRRYAVASHAGLRIRSGNASVDQSITWRFRKQGAPCGVGFEMEVDAIRFVLRLPPLPHLAIDWSDPGTARAARCARYAWEAQHGETLKRVEPNSFRRGWLAQIFQTAAVMLAAQREWELRQAIDALGQGQDAAMLADVLQTVFQSPEPQDDDSDTACGTGGAPPDRLRTALTTALHDTRILSALACTARTLIDPIDADWDPWFKRILMHTLGAAILESIGQICPQVDTDELSIDIEPGPQEDGTLRDTDELWLSETNPGGNGLIEQVVETLVSDPSVFFRGVESALSASEFEVIDVQLRDFVERIGGSMPDEGLIAHVHAVRAAVTSQTAHSSLGTLRRSLLDRGHTIFHGYVAALSSRLLRPDSPQALDDLLAHVISCWDEWEDQYGIEIDARVACALFSNDSRIDAAFADMQIDLPAGDRRAWRFSVLTGILWARGHALRNGALPLQTRFDSIPPVTERLLLHAWLTPHQEPVDATTPDWSSRLHQRLLVAGRCGVAMPAQREILDAVVEEVLSRPVQLEYLNAYPRLTSVVRGEGLIELQFELTETM